MKCECFVVGLMDFCVGILKCYFKYSSAAKMPSIPYICRSKSPDSIHWNVYLKIDANDLQEFRFSLAINI